MFTGTCHPKAVSLLGPLSNCGQTWVGRTQAACSSLSGHLSWVKGRVKAIWVCILARTLGVGAQQITFFSEP